jgi:acetoin utilization deacetylase AcuC-like enzyme
MVSGGLYFSHPASIGHDPRPFMPRHPDTPERLMALEAALAERGWLGWERREAPAASEAELERVHSPAYVRAVRELCDSGGGLIDPDTAVVPESWPASLHAAGGSCEMARALVSGDAATAYCAIRPSGHHAERERAMGFCVFDNVAVAAAMALADLGLTRVFILDWDVHHGNGTAEIFRTRRDVLFASLHQSPLYPGTGPLEDAGSGAGEGFTINLPVPPGTGPELWMELIDRVVLPAARAYEPELILVSSGYDAHAADPLAHCLLETETFAAMAGRMRSLAAQLGAGLGLVQEGGYEPSILAECVCAVLPVLAGEGGELDEGARRTGDPLAAHAVDIYRQWWPAG